MDNKAIPEYAFEESLFDGNSTVADIKPEDKVVENKCSNGDKKITAQMSKLFVVCLIVAISTISSALSVFVYDKFFATHIMAVDIKGYLATQRDRYLEGKINDEQLAKSLDYLESYVNTLPKNKKIIMGDVVVRNIDVVKP
ncbi:MAG TPA: hypothetical protein PK661_02100 [Syntrophorhabdaceae bacterium]|nr:hypothetical protein [Syntrophorhabdaceae bacterium]MDI9560221.1 hypothetical protein [Pseudomonadota bacterium]HOS58864.1 hypothetical protein [Syntrophorhabdaceae bacterium]